MGEALRLYRQLLERNPENPGLKARIAAIQSSAEPGELAGRAAVVAAPTLEHSRNTTQEQLAEALFEQGDYAGAAAVYERILRARPDNQLARERFEEIRTLASMNPGTSQAGLPEDPKGLLEGLLYRIASRRKG